MEQKTILIADDNALSRSILKRLFEKEYTVLQAADGKEAFDLFREQAGAVAAVLLDLLMPEYDGMYFLEQMRQLDPACTVPVICISGDERESSVIRSYHLGAENYITKPFNTDHVRRVVHSAVEQARSREPAHSEYDNMAMLGRLMAVLNRCYADKDAFHTALEIVGAYLGADRVSLYIKPFQSPAFQWRREGAADSYLPTYRWMLDNDWCAGMSDPEEWLLYVGPEYGNQKQFSAYYREYGVRTMQWVKLDGVREERAYLSIENAALSNQDIVLYAALQSCFSLAVKAVELGIVDQQTGMYNRRLYTEYMRELSHSRLTGLGVIVMNVNSMHQYISIYGQDAGDELLERTAEVIRRFAGDTCFRTGGDEFTVVLRNRTREATEALMARISAACREQNIGLSLGCEWRDTGINPEEQFKAADRNMRQAKQKHYDSLNVTNRTS